MKMHFTVQSSVTTKCVPLFQQQKCANNDDYDINNANNENNKL